MQLGTEKMGKIINENDWIEDFRPKPAPRQGSGFDFGEGCTLVDGNGPGDGEYLASVGEKHVWTVVDDGEATAISPGFHHVNRLGYIVTENPWSDDIDEVELEGMDD